MVSIIRYNRGKRNEDKIINDYVCNVEHLYCSAGHRKDFHENFRQDFGDK
jgi:hypothetical protein